MPSHRAGPGPRTDWEAESANALPAQRDKSWPPTWRRCYGDVTSMHKVYLDPLVSLHLGGLDKNPTCHSMMIHQPNFQIDSECMPHLHDFGVVWLFIEMRTLFCTWRPWLGKTTYLKFWTFSGFQLFGYIKPFFVICLNFSFQIYFNFEKIAYQV